MQMAFWKQAFVWHGSVTPRVLPRVLAFGFFAALVWMIQRQTGLNLQLPIAPYEVAGAVLGVLMVLRVNAGYDRWWEARKLWGGIVNQTRNLSIMAVEYGPREGSWREEFVRLVATFPHAVRRKLRGETDIAEADRLLPASEAARVRASQHGALRIAQMIAGRLRSVVDADQLDRFAFMQADRERAALVDHMGACERILKSPLPSVYAIKVRRFLVLFLATLPFALLEQAGALTPLIILPVAYTLLGVDQIAVELENPFRVSNLSHLPLEDICHTIEENLFEVLLDVGDDLGIGDEDELAASSIDGEEQNRRLPRLASAS